MDAPRRRTPAMADLVLSFIAVPMALVDGPLGGELVDRLGVEVDNGAHLNAPNSLSGRPATGTVCIRKAGWLGSYK